MMQFLINMYPLHCTKYASVTQQKYCMVWFWTVLCATPPLIPLAALIISFINEGQILQHFSLCLFGLTDGIHLSSSQNLHSNMQIHSMNYACSSAWKLSRCCLPSQPPEFSYSSLLDTRALRKQTSWWHTCRSCYILIIVNIQEIH